MALRGPGRGLLSGESGAEAETPRPGARAESERPGAWSSAWLPVSAWLLATIVVVTTCAFRGHSPFTTAPWIHWDAYQYIDISRHGYVLFQCFFPNGLLTWCGNAGWFPAYPWLIHAITLLGFVSHAVVAISLSWLFDFGAVLLIWAAFYRRTGRTAAAVAVLFAAFAPGLIYDYAAFPLSMLAFFTVLYLVLLDRERWFLAGLAGSVAVLTYPVGVAAPVAAAFALLFVYRDVPLLSRLRRIALSVVPPALALALFAYIQKRETKHWDAYFLGQANFRHDFTNPFSRAFHALHLLVDWKLFTLANAPFAQTLIVTFTVVAITLVLGWRLAGPFFGRHAIRPFHVLVGLWMIGAWLIPQGTTAVSQYRGEAALLPAAILVGTLPRALAWPIVIALAALVVPMEVLFLRNTLV